MPRGYQHISNYEKEILELKSQELTLKEIEYIFLFCFISAVIMPNITIAGYPK